jgi:DNA-binding XRE family transcriptional regulator
MDREINNRLKQVRRILDISQKDFALKLSIKQGSLSDIERGRIGVSSKVANSICNEFAVNPTWLHTGVGEMFKVKNYNIQGKDTGVNTGENGSMRGMDARMALKMATGSNSGYWVLFNDELKNERPDLAELITLFAQLGRFTDELPDVNKTYFKPILDRLDLLTENNYGEYKRQAISLLEGSLKHRKHLEPVVAALKKFIDGGDFPIPFEEL